MTTVLSDTRHILKSFHDWSPAVYYACAIIFTPVIIVGLIATAIVIDATWQVIPSPIRGVFGIVVAVYWIVAFWRWLARP